MARRRRRNPWVSVGEVLTWVLFAALLFPAGFAGWAVGHYTSLGGRKTAAPRTVTVTAPSRASTTAAGTTSAPTTSSGTTTSAAAADPALGKSLFATNCGSCHTLAAAGTSGTIGPDLSKRLKSDAQAAGQPLAAYVHESIVDPNAYVASGYAKGLMPQTFATQFSKSQLDDLVAFVVQNAG